MTSVETAAQTPQDGLFTIEIRRETVPVVVLQGRSSDDGGVTVEAEFYPGAPDRPELRRTFAFGSRDRADKFVEETLAALECLDCAVTEW